MGRCSGEGGTSIRAYLPYRPALASTTLTHSYINTMHRRICYLLSDIRLAPRGHGATCRW